jgi:hypothetical protein
MVRRTFYALPNEAPPEIEPVEIITDVHTIKWGYNIADIEKAARIGASRAFGGRNLDRLQRYETAWSGVVEAVYSAVTRPDMSDLIAAGGQQVTKAMQDNMRQHGCAREGGNAKQFSVYGHDAARAAPSPERRVVERTALWQIWPQLLDTDRRAFLALATWGDRHTAAQALGIPFNTFKEAVNRARARFLTLWHEGEQPSRVWCGDRPVGTATCRGKRRLTEADLEEIRDRRYAGETLKVIAEDYGYSISALSKHLRGVVRPAPAVASK